MIDISDPANCRLAARGETYGETRGVTVVKDRVYTASSLSGLQVWPSIPGVQFTVRVDAAASDIPFTIETTSNLLDPNSWTPLWTTNSATMPFDYVDFKSPMTDKRQVFYRVRQP